MALLPRWAREVHKMFWYLTVPVFSVWAFNKDFFRDKINFPMLKSFLTADEYKNLLYNAKVYDETVKEK